MAGQLARADGSGWPARDSGLLGDAEGLALLDAAAGAAEALLVPARLDLARLAAAATVPPLLSGLVRRGAARPPGRRRGRPRRAGGPAGRDARAERDAACGRSCWRRRRWCWAWPGPEAVEAGRSFRDLGFDSLTAVELRNQLAARYRPAAARHAGVQLPDAGRAGGLPAGQNRQRRDRPRRTGPVEAALSGLDRNSDKRLKIAARLEALAREFRAGTADSGPADDELAVATDDEMFDLIDQELGIPR